MSTLLWLRQDLRLADNPALARALAGGGAVIPVYLHAPDEEGAWPPGAASSWWLSGSLKALQADLRARGSDLIVRTPSDAAAELLDVAREVGATRVLWNRRYEPAAIDRDAAVKLRLRRDGLEAESYNGSLLWEPWEVKTKTGSPYQVFTPFWRQCLTLSEPANPLAAPPAIPAPPRWPRSAGIAALGLAPRIDWAQGLRDSWTPGEAAALARLRTFLSEGLEGYPAARDRPDLPATSGMSPYLHFGEISPRQIWNEVRQRALRGSDAGLTDKTWRDHRFLTEIGWREFGYHLLYHFPETPDRPLRPAYAKFPWKDDLQHLRAWQRGRTGYPIVDAGMRQLWHTGWMHNRVRMIVASFLVKHLLINWTHGARWFWDTLVDADLASNTQGWQWTAGCGADAAPYFRIFNPIMQGRKFDAEGVYVRRWVPELARLSNEWMHEPWAAPADELRRAGVTLGREYPGPIVNHGAAREAALAALATLKN
jgi:deoxyribodipyrimidine photo-lyase